MYVKEIKYYIVLEVHTILNFEDRILRTKILRKIVIIYLA